MSVQSSNHSIIEPKPFLTQRKSNQALHTHVVKWGRAKLRWSLFSCQRGLKLEPVTTTHILLAIVLPQTPKTRGNKKLGVKPEIATIRLAEMVIHRNILPS